LVGVTAAPREALAVDEVRVGTLAPRDSVWGKTLAAWAASVHQESGGQLKVSLYFGGSQGDEPELVQKLKDRAIDGAALSGTGLSAFSRDVAALELPGVLPSYSRLDRARNAVRSKIAEGFDRAGVRLLAEGDTGTMRLFSREAEVKSPRDLGRMKPFLRPDDLLSKTYFDGVGLFSRPPTVPVAQVLSALMPNRPAVAGDAGAPPPHVNVVFASALAVSELKWADMLEYVTPQPVAYGVGGIVIHAGRFEGLPPEARAILKRTAEATSSLLSQRVRAADDAAFARLRAEKKNVDLDDTSRTEWAALCQTVRDRFRARTPHPEIVDMVVAAGQ